MKVNATVKEDGPVATKDSKSLSGKKIKIILKERKEKKSLTAWSEISTILKEADTLNIPERSLSGILNDIRNFRESK